MVPLAGDGVAAGGTFSDVADSIGRGFEAAGSAALVVGCRTFRRFTPAGATDGRRPWQPARDAGRQPDVASAQSGDGAPPRRAEPTRA